MIQASSMRRRVASTLAALLVWLSPGPLCHEAVAAAFKAAPIIQGPISAAPAIRLAPLPGSVIPGAGVLPGMSLTPLSPALALPALIPAVAPAAPAASPAAPGGPLAIEGLSQAIAPEITAIAQPQAGADASAASGRRIEDLILGKAGAPASGEVDASFSAPGENAGGSGLAKASAGPSSEKAPESAPAAAVQAQASKPVDSSVSYGFKRRVLASVAAMYGLVISLPVIGPSLTAKVTAQAAAKKVIFSDFDDTIGPHNSVLTPEMAASVAAVRKNGKEVVVITDRPDEKRPNSTTLTVFESLESIPAADRAGMYVAANSGGRVYRYNAQGQPEKVFEAPALPSEEVAVIKAAAEATKARLASIGATQNTESPKNPAESYNPYGYALMLVPGTSEATVKEAAKILQQELDSRGYEAQVIPRLAKDLKNPPYVMFSKLDKSVSVAFIAKALGVTADQAVAIGDSMYMPRTKEGALSRAAAAAKKLGERFSGAAMPLTGNETDRNMEKGLPGMLSLSVGGTADPRMKNGYVLPGRGAAASKKILDAMAAHSSKAAEYKEPTPLAAGLTLLALLAGGALGYYVMFKAFVDVFTGNVTGPALPDGVPYYGPYGIEDIFQALGLAGMAGMAGMMRPRETLAPAAQLFERAYSEASAAAESMGRPGAKLMYGQATASLPLRDGEHWKFSFYVMDSPKAATADIISVDFSRGPVAVAGKFTTKTQIYRGVPRHDDLKLFPMSPYLFSRGAVMLPESALTIAQKAFPWLSSSVSVSLEMVKKTEGDDLWYRFYDSNGGAAEVNARTGEAEAVTVPVRERQAQGTTLLEKVTAVDAWLDDNIPMYDIAKWIVGFGIGMWLLNMAFGFMSDPASFLKNLFSAAGLVAVAGVVKKTGKKAPKYSAEQLDADIKAKAEAIVGAESVVVSYRRVTATFSDRAAMKAAPAQIAGLDGKSYYVAKELSASAVAAENAAFESEHAARLSAIAGVVSVSFNHDGSWPWIDMVFSSVDQMKAADGEYGKNLPPLPSASGRAYQISTRLSSEGRPVADSAIEGAAKSVVASKGGIWSSTEYNMGYSTTLSSLVKAGASDDQIERYKALCDAAPVIGGRFNPWSGD